MLSSPAIMRSVVDLPQPEGPSRIMNSPSRICRLNVIHRLHAVGIELADVVRA